MSLYRRDGRAFETGQRVFYLQQMKWGYGWDDFHVPATIIRDEGWSRVLVRIECADGSTHDRWVAPGNIQEPRAGETR